MQAFHSFVEKMPPKLVPSCDKWHTLYNSQVEGTQHAVTDAVTVSSYQPYTVTVKTASEGSNVVQTGESPTEKDHEFPELNLIFQFLKFVDYCRAQFSNFPLQSWRQCTLAQRPLL